RIEEEKPGFLASLEESLGTEDVVRISAWWRKACCGLAVLVLWLSKHRSGVVSDMTTSEWTARRQKADKTIFVVAKHKTGDKDSSCGPSA
ncbi:HTH psq-type domain-containing protein, partial [Aphis craccivora]